MIVCIKCIIAISSKSDVNDADQFMCTDSYLYTPVTSTEVTVKNSVQ